MTNTTKEDELLEALKAFQDYTASWGYPMNQEVHSRGLEIAHGRIMKFIKQYGLEQRIDEHSLWKPIAEEIVEKDGVYRAVNFLNERAQELTTLKERGRE